MKDAAKLNEDGNKLCTKCEQLEADIKVEDVLLCEVCKAAFIERLKSDIADKYEGMSQDEILEKMLDEAL